MPSIEEQNNANIRRHNRMQAAIWGLVILVCIVIIGLAAANVIQGKTIQIVIYAVCGSISAFMLYCIKELFYPSKIRPRRY